MSVISGPNLATNGLMMCLDSGNPTSFSPNVQPSPLDIYAWAGAGGAYQGTLSRDYTTAPSPAGGIPMLFATANPGTSSYTGTYNSPTWNLAPAANGQTWTMSFWVKGSSAFTGALLIFEANSSGNYTTYGYASYSVTPGWTRVTASYTMTQATTAYVQVRFDCPNNSVSMWVDGLQVERSSSATAFNAKTNTNGTNWSDLTTYQNTGTLVNYPVYASNNSLSFDGTSNYADVSGNGFVNGMSAYTICYWANRVAGNRMPVAGRLDTAFYWYGDNSWRYTHGGVGGEFYYPKAVSIPDNTWGFFCCVYDGANVRIYRNGVYEGQQATTGTANWAQGMRIGFWTGGAGYYWSGYISNVSFYNRALSDSEVQQNFNALRGRYSV
jgi:hypothetical protein